MGLGAIIGLAGTLLGGGGRRERSPGNPTDAVDQVNIGQSQENVTGNTTQTQTGNTSTRGNTATTGSQSTLGGSSDIGTQLQQMINSDTTTNRDQTNQNTTNLTNQSTTERGAITGTGVTSNFDSRIMGQLNGLLSNAISSGGISSGQSALNNRLRQITSQGRAPGFNPETFVAGVTQQARADANNGLEQRLNEMTSSMGGSETGNTMAALLGNRMRSDTAAELAGVTANARATATQLEQAENQSITQQMLQLQGGSSGTLTNLIQALSGAQQTNSTNQLNTNTGSMTGTDRGSMSGTTIGSGTSTGSQIGNTSTSNTNTNNSQTGTTSNTTDNQTVNTNLRDVTNINQDTTGSNTGLQSGSNDNTEDIFARFNELFNGLNPVRPTPTTPRPGTGPTVRPPTTPVRRPTVREPPDGSGGRN